MMFALGTCVPLFKSPSVAYIMGGFCNNTYLVTADILQPGAHKERSRLQPY